MSSVQLSLTKIKKSLSFKNIGETLSPRAISTALSPRQISRSVSEKSLPEVNFETLDSKPSTPTESNTFFIEEINVICEDKKTKLTFGNKKLPRITLPKNKKYEIKIEVYDTQGLDGLTIDENIKTITTVNKTNYVLKEEFKPMEKKVITIPPRLTVHKLVMSQTLVSIRFCDLKKNELFVFQFEYE
eukprot:gene5573-9389_t